MANNDYQSYYDHLVTVEYLVSLCPRLGITRDSMLQAVKQYLDSVDIPGLEGQIYLRASGTVRRYQRSRPRNLVFTIDGVTYVNGVAQGDDDDVFLVEEGRVFEQFDNGVVRRPRRR